MRAGKLCGNEKRAKGEDFGGDTVRALNKERSKLSSELEAEGDSGLLGTQLSAREGIGRVVIGRNIKNNWHELRDPNIDKSVRDHARLAAGARSPVRMSMVDETWTTKPKERRFRLMS